MKIYLSVLLTVGFGLLSTAPLSVAHVQRDRDSVYLVSDASGRNSVARGKVVATSAFGVTIEADGKRREITNDKIKKVVFSDEPRGLSRARDHFDGQRYDDCLEAVKKLEKTPDSKYVQQELKFFEAYSVAKKALRGDQTTTTAAAEELVSAFVKANSDSYRLVWAVDVYGQLLMANGKMQLAQKEFNRLTKSRWPEYVARGYFFEGETLIHLEKYSQAQQSFQSLVGLSNRDDGTKQFQLLAKCELAKIAGLDGDAKAAIKTIQQMIQRENSDNTQLFAYAYNALGTCYLKTNDLKKACRAFLHTDLLFSTEPDAHAEALYYLAKIWPQLKETDRANRARELLTSRYRNTIWTSKL